MDSRSPPPRSAFGEPSPATFILNILFVVAAAALAVTPAMLVFLKHGGQGWRDPEILATDVAVLGALVAALAARFARRDARLRAACALPALGALAAGSVCAALLAKGGALQGVFVATIATLLSLGLVGLTRISTATRPLVAAVLAFAVVGILFVLVLPTVLPFPRGLGLRSWFEAGVVLVAVGLALAVPALVRARAL